jgi:hypothetical protein
MEERLDDAINVLRSHCEPQLNLPLGMDAASLSGHSSFVPTQAPQSQSTSSGQDAAVSLPLDIPVKVERTTVPSASSECLILEVLGNVPNRKFLFLRRETKGATRFRHKAQQQLSQWNSGQQSQRPEKTETIVSFL